MHKEETIIEEIIPQTDDKHTEKPALETPLDKKSEQIINRYIPSLATMAVKQFFADKQNEAAWQEFYEKHRLHSWKEIYDDICSEEYFNKLIPESMALKIWHALVEKNRSKKIKEAESLVKISVRKILEGPHGVKFWNLINQSPKYENRKELEDGIVQLCNQLGIVIQPAERESLIRNFIEILEAWYKSVKRVNKELKNLKLSPLYEEWILDQGSYWFDEDDFKRPAGELLYLDSINWANCNDEEYFSAIQLAVKCNHSFWLNDQKIVAAERWQRLMQSTQIIKQLKRAFSTQFNTSAATSWIVFFNLLPENIQQTILLAHGARMLVIAATEYQIEHLRYFWDKLPDTVSLPNFSGAIMSAMERFHQVDAIRDVIGFLYEHLSADDFFAWDKCLWGRLEEHHPIYRLIAYDPEYFVYFWERADKQRQLQWLDASNNGLLDYASSRGQVKVVKAIWQSLPERQTQLIAQWGYSFSQIENLDFKKADDLLATKKFLYESNPDFQERMIQDQNYKLFHDTAGNLQIKTTNWLWDVASSTHRRRMIESRPTTLLWLLKYYVKEKIEDTRSRYKECLYLADKILCDLAKDNSDVYLELLEVFSNPKINSTDRKIKIPEDRRYQLEEFWIFLCCEYFFGQRDSIPTHIQQFIAQAFTLSKLYHCLITIRPNKRFGCLMQLLSYESKEADQFAALLWTNFPEVDVDADFRQLQIYNKWRATASYFDPATLQQFMCDIGICQPVQVEQEISTTTDRPEAEEVQPSAFLQAPMAFFEKPPLPTQMGQASISSELPQKDETRFAQLTSSTDPAKSAVGKFTPSCSGLYYFTAIGAVLSAAVAVASVLELMNPALFLSAFQLPIALLITAAIVTSLLTMACVSATIYLLCKRSDIPPSDMVLSASKKAERVEPSESNELPESSPIEMVLPAISI